jgi:hypothetical protein
LPRKDNRNYSPRPPDIKEGMKWLEKLLGKLDNLEVVVLCGSDAQKATGFFYTKHERLCVLHAPHPATRSMTQPCKEERLQAATRKAARLLDAGRM